MSASNFTQETSNSVLKSQQTKVNSLLSVKKKISTKSNSQFSYLSSLESSCIFCTKPNNSLLMFSSSNKEYISTKLPFNQERFHPSVLDYSFLTRRKNNTPKEEKPVCEKLQHKSVLLAAAHSISLSDGVSSFSLTGGLPRFCSCSGEARSLVS